MCANAIYAGMLSPKIKSYYSGYAFKLKQAEVYLRSKKKKSLICVFRVPWILLLSIRVIE